MPNPCDGGCKGVRMVDGRPAPFSRELDCGICFAWLTNDALNRLWGGTGAEYPVEQPKPQPQRSANATPPEPCKHSGGAVPHGERERLQIGHLKRWQYCDHPKRPLGRIVCPCSGCGPSCSGYQVDEESGAALDSDVRAVGVAPAGGPAAGASAKALPAPVSLPSDPAAGVVIGSYKWPSLVALQIATIRATCGPVPICVSTDDPATAAAVQRICNEHPDVFHWPNHERIGHTGGDISAFFKAAVWGSLRGLRVVAKLSQRFFITRPRWLQDGATELLTSGLSLASQRCRGTARFDLRTEACLLDVATWCDPAILQRIMPRRYWTDSPKGLSAETVIYRVLQDLGGEYFLPWSLFGEDRSEKYPGVVWHNSHGVDDYRMLAKEHGVELDAGFHVDGWQRDRTAGAYHYG